MTQARMKQSPVNQAPINQVLEAIGVIESPYAEKFSVPRQPGLVTSAETRLVLKAPFNHSDFVEGLEQFSHCWLVFAFHQNLEAGWKAKVRPPRLGGNQKLGVFATRSSFRPNGLGLSVMELAKIEHTPNGPVLVFKGGDLVNGTPVYDIKPYVPYADSHPDAQGGFAQSAPESDLTVQWQDAALAQAKEHGLGAKQRAVVEQVLAQDPRPAYKKQSNDERIYGVTLFHVNLRWQVIDKQLVIIEVNRLDR